ncbi:hypothetical protein [Kitasatospora sp. NPDC005751]|uniref:ATP dependent DNA ligase n=1 Tax=unclassified Kitasatospora TaxID=2633591 RepID=UPI0033C62F91
MRRPRPRRRLRHLTWSSVCATGAGGEQDGAVAARPGGESVEGPRCQAGGGRGEDDGAGGGTEVRFVRPELRAEVEFLELTPAGRLRHPVWRGLRE